VDLADEWRAAVRTRLPDAVDLRHRVHADPRLSGFEEDTAALIADVMGCGTGVPAATSGRLIQVSAGHDGSTGSKAVTLRTELDALPVAETTTVPWRSTTGAMHCCGHDVHMAAVAAVARAAADVDLPAPLQVLLQPREEGSRSGALDVVREGLLVDTDAVIGAHLQPQLPPGTLGATPGPVNAGTDEFTITVSGRGGHSGYPHTVDDSVLALSSIIVALQQIPARRIDPVVGSVCMVNQVHGGTADNVVPSTVRASGTARTMREVDRATMQAALRDISRYVAEAHGCSAEVEIRQCEPPLHNDTGLALAVFPLLADMGHHLSSEFRSFGADDFSYYGSAVRALMLFVGTGTSTGGLHDASFLPGDEYVGIVADALIAGYCAAVLTRVAV
jgi:amidohydrolase